jgi:hypothetical protein
MVHANFAGNKGLTAETWGREFRPEFGPRDVIRYVEVMGAKRLRELRPRCSTHTTMD